jgi:hypothetical protein
MVVSLGLFLFLVAATANEAPARQDTLGKETAP